MTEDLRLKRLARNVYQAQYRAANRERYNAYQREYSKRPYVKAKKNERRHRKREKLRQKVA